MNRNHAEQFLHKIYSRNTIGGKLDVQWIHGNIGVIDSAVDAGLAICGSLGMAIGHQNPYKNPADLDFVGKDLRDTITFLDHLMNVAGGYRTYVKATLSSRTHFVPENATHHLRIECPLWMPICVFTIDPKNFRIWFACMGLRVQKYNDIRAAAKVLQAIDHKPRPDLHEKETTHPLNTDLEDDIFADFNPLTGTLKPQGSIRKKKES